MKLRNSKIIGKKKPLIVILQDMLIDDLKKSNKSLELDNKTLVEEIENLNEKIFELEEAISELTYENDTLKDRN